MYFILFAFFANYVIADHIHVKKPDADTQWVLREPADIEWTTEGKDFETVDIDVFQNVGGKWTRVMELARGIPIDEKKITASTSAFVQGSSFRLEFVARRAKDAETDVDHSDVFSVVRPGNEDAQNTETGDSQTPQSSDEEIQEAVGEPIKEAANDVQEAVGQPIKEAASDVQEAVGEPIKKPNDAEPIEESAGDVQAASLDSTEEPKQNIQANGVEDTNTVAVVPHGNGAIKPDDRGNIGVQEQSLEVQDEPATQGQTSSGDLLKVSIFISSLSTFVLYLIM